jgi:microcompartment protein CcmL/EutN
VTGIDAALKAANVQLTGPMKNVGSGLCNAVITGDVAAVKAAIDAAADTAAQLGEVVSAHVIARPDDAIESVLPVKKAARK